MSAPDAPPPPPTSWRQRLELLVDPPHRLRPGQFAAAAAGVVALAVVGWFVLREPTGPPVESVLPMAGASAGAAPSTSSDLVVHAAGAVRAPGVYRLPDGSRVADLLDAAGGPAADADLDRLNLAAPLVDGAQVYVPRQGEPVPSGVVAAGAAQPAGPLDLNTATVEQLDALPGIGPATAEAIVAERERRGGFRSVDELLEVRGIGPAKLEALRGLVTV